MKQFKNFFILIFLQITIAGNVLASGNSDDSDGYVQKVDISETSIEMFNGIFDNFNMETRACIIKKNFSDENCAELWKKFADIANECSGIKSYTDNDCINELYFYSPLENFFIDLYSLCESISVSGNGKCDAGKMQQDIVNFLSETKDNKYLTTILYEHVKQIYDDVGTMVYRRIGGKWVKFP